MGICRQYRAEWLWLNQIRWGTIIMWKPNYYRLCGLGRACVCMVCAATQRVIKLALSISHLHTHIWLYLSELNVSKVIILSNEALKWFSILPPFIRPFISPMWCETNRVSISIIPNGKSVWFAAVWIIDWKSNAWDPLINSIIHFVKYQ